MDPALDEFLALPLASQRRFPGGERAGDAEQRFAHHEADRREVQQAEGAAAREGPAQGDAEPGRRQAPDDKRDEGRVDDEDRVGERGVQEVIRAPAGACLRTSLSEAGVTAAATLASCASAPTLGYG